LNQGLKNKKPQPDDLTSDGGPTINATPLGEIPRPLFAIYWGIFLRYLNKVKRYREICIRK
jgi:hypothetical protein